MNRLSIDLEEGEIECLRDIAHERNIATGEVAREIVRAFLMEMLIPAPAVMHSNDEKCCNNCGSRYRRLKLIPGSMQTEGTEDYCIEGQPINNRCLNLIVCPLWNKKVNPTPTVM